MWIVGGDPIHRILVANFPVQCHNASCSAAHHFYPGSNQGVTVVGKLRPHHGRGVYVPRAPCANTQAVVLTGDGNPHGPTFLYRITVLRNSSVVQCSAVQCSAVQCSAVCSAVQCSAVQCSAVQCSAVQCAVPCACSAVQCSVQCGAVQCSACSVQCRVHVVQCSAVQCSEVQCSAG